MSMFTDPFDEETICLILKAFVEEWGPEHVVVSVPTHWQAHCDHRLGRVALEFTTSNTVAIRVEYDGVVINRAFQLELV